MILYLDSQAHNYEPRLPLAGVPESVSTFLQEVLRAEG